MKHLPPSFKPAMKTLSCCVVLTCAYLFVCQTSAAQIIKRKGVTWVAPVTEIIRLKEYEVKEVAEPNGTRRVYIRRVESRDWKLFYVRERFLLVTLGHRRRLVLVNDCPATKFCKVAVADLASGKVKQIDRLAIEMYRNNASPDDRLVIIPQAYAFSPDDREVLINMELLYIRISGDEKGMAKRLAKRYKNWWYVVDLRNERVLREYRTSKIPKRWWTYYSQGPSFNTSLDRSGRRIGNDEG